MGLKLWARANCVSKFRKADRTRVVVTAAAEEVPTVLEVQEVALEGAGASVAVDQVASVVMAVLEVVLEAIQEVAIVKILVVLVSEIHVVIASVRQTTEVMVQVAADLIHAITAAAAVVLAVVVVAVEVLAETEVVRDVLLVPVLPDLVSKKTFDSLLIFHEKKQLHKKLNFMFF